MIFGHSLGDTDSHLIDDAMKKWKPSRIAISIREDQSVKIIARKAELQKKLPDANLEFFKAERHPLGR